MASLKTSAQPRSVSVSFVLRNCRVFVACFVILAWTMSRGRASVAWDPENCPHFCRCLRLYGLRWADCTGHRLYSVETGVERDVQALDLSNNSVSSLADYELRDAGLTRLKLLNLSSNAINVIGLTAFADLSELRVLDLSGNHLYSILEDTFVKNNKLEVLELADNNFNQRVPKLRSSSLGSLDLSNCGIGHLPSNAFDGLPRLRALDLSDNMMIQLELEVFNGLTSLAILMIERNPWACNGNMYQLQKQLAVRRIDFKKVCDESESPGSKSIFVGKLEKMIAPARQPDKASTERTPGRLLAKVRNWKLSLNVESASKRCQQSRVTSNVHSRKNSPTDSAFSTTWAFSFFAIGLILGSAISTTFTYIWLARMTLRRPRRQLSHPPCGLEIESSDVANQRVSLLQHLCQSNQDAERSAIQCPGTPPPPYRDVVLHSSRYPRRNSQCTLVYGIGESNLCP